MRVHRYIGVLGLLIALAPAWAQKAPPSATAAGDNSKVNQRDQSESEPTADQQQNNASDLNLAKQIRRALTEDKSMSIYAHNVKVIAQNGKVTLKGPVRSEDEKSAVIAKAAQLAGASNINDELTVVPKSD